MNAGRLTGWLVGMFTAAGASVAGAAPAPSEPSGRRPAVAVLIYDVPAELIADGGCPSARAFTAAVRAHLGYDPFQRGAPLSLAIKLRTAAGRALAGELTTWRADGALLSQRRVDSAAGDCSELLATLGLMAELVLAPPGAKPGRVALPGEDAAAPPPPQAPAPDSIAGELRLPEAARPAGPRWRIAAGGQVSRGAEIAPAGGVSIGGGAAWARAAVDLELHFELPSTAALAGGGQARTAAVSVELVPCLQLTEADFTWGPCALAAIGALRADGLGLSNERSLSAVAAQIGGRLRLGHTLVGQLGVEAAADLLAPLVINTLSVQGQPIWTTPPLAWRLGLSLTYGLR